MAQDSTSKNQIVQFLRQRDYELVKELGQGACAKTVLLYDPQIDEQFVCKKYVPYSEGERQELFAAFVREIKLLHKIHHPNVVRVFNYYLYPEFFTGYILMEFVDGSEVDDYLSEHPEQANEVFLQTISGFAYLQRAGILHRDIRPPNVMVGEDGTVKIIDLGFGKEVRRSGDFNKSIDLNWWCEPPPEFNESRYDFCTEVYFVGKLFEQIIHANDIAHFQYVGILRRMCIRDPAARIQSFAEIEKEIGNNQFLEIEFSEAEKNTYRGFADAMSFHIAKIEANAKYQEDAARIQKQLEAIYRDCMLEEYVPNVVLVLRCLVIGNYEYYQGRRLSVSVVRDFIHLIKACSDDKRRIILANLHTRLDSRPRYSQSEEEDDTIPF